MSDWGKTGRVTIDCGDKPLPDVRVDDEWIGYLYTPDPNYEGWGARHAATGRCADHLPTRDAAIMWVLRRVDPALWRQERGDVWATRINRLTPSERRRHPGTAPEAWQHHVVSPSGEVVAGFFYRSDALDYALEQVSR